MIITITKDSLECFKRSWPCNGIPSLVDGIVVCFDDDGDLVDYDAFDSEGNEINLDEDYDVDGLALSTLFDNAKNHHSTTTNAWPHPQLSYRHHSYLQYNHSSPIDTIRTY